MWRPMRFSSALAAGALLAAIAMVTAPAAASPYIDVHFSIKVIRHPVFQTRPPIDDGGPQLLTDAHIDSMFTTANDSLLVTYWRGYRFVLDEIVDIGSACPFGCLQSNPSYWYGATFPDGSGDMLTMETEAMGNPAFVWRTNAVNIYINQGKGDGAVASFPPPDPRSNHIVIVGSRVFEPDYIHAFAGSTFAHEIGHYFNLPHPNGSVMPCCNPSTCILDGDGLGDTLPDGPCFDQDDLSDFHFGVPYSTLGWQDAMAIDDIYWNLMGYLHPDQPYGQTFMYRQTEDQLDRWTDAANGVRAAVRSGQTWFVSTAGSIFGSGSSASPFFWPSQGIGSANAAGGDIVLLRPGTYAQNITINKKVTLRATRGGPAVIGS
jgi:hypothetical protein